MNTKLINIELIKKLDKILVLDNIKNNKIFVTVEHTNTEIESVMFHDCNDPHEDFFTLNFNLQLSKNMTLRYCNMSITYFPDLDYFKFNIDNESISLRSNESISLRSNESNDYMFNITIQYGIDEDLLKTVLKWYNTFNTYIDNMKGYFFYDEL